MSFTEGSEGHEASGLARTIDAQRDGAFLASFGILALLASLRLFFGAARPVGNDLPCTNRPFRIVFLDVTKGYD